jgi:hypothetical protein
MTSSTMPQTLPQKRQGFSSCIRDLPPIWISTPRISWRRSIVPLEPLCRTATAASPVLQPCSTELSSHLANGDRPAREECFATGLWPDAFKRNKGLLKPNDRRGLNNPSRSVFFQSNLWTIGQLIEKPELPNAVPAGKPVIKPSCA